MRPHMQDEPLSGFERRCLLKHICECREVIQMTLLGAGSARDKARAIAELCEICEALSVAEQQLRRAEALAARHLP